MMLLRHYITFFFICKNKTVKYPEIFTEVCYNRKKHLQVNE